MGFLLWEPTVGFAPRTGGEMQQLYADVVDGEKAV